MPSGYAAWKGRRGWAKLAKPWKHRLSMMKTMVTQLLENEKINTTLAKAQALQPYTDTVVGLGKKGTHQAWIKAGGIVRTDRELHKLFTTFALRYRDREGGYTRVVPTGFRELDAAPMAVIELVDRPGELRAARRPKHETPLLPPAAQAFLRQAHPETAFLRQAQTETAFLRQAPAETALPPGRQRAMMDQMATLMGLGKTNR